MKTKVNLAYHQLFLYFNLSFLAGVATNSFLTGVSQWFWFSALGLALVLLVLIFSQSTWLIFPLAIFSGFWIGGYLVGGEIEKLDNLYEGNFSAAVKVVREPEERERYQQVIVAPVDGESDLEKETLIRKRVLVFAPLKPSYQYGEELKLKCELKKPDSQLGRFNYQRFLAKNGVYQVCNNPQIIKVESTKKELSFSWKDGLLSNIFKFRRFLEGRINQLLPQPESAYLAGLLLGGEGRLPEKVAENFRLTGTTHVVAVSGSNIAIVSQILILIAIAIGLWRWQAFGLAITGIALFVVMIGAPASAIRAAIMGGLLIWATSAGRLTDSGRAVLWAAVIMTAFSPLILVYDVGFQLSVMATLGIIYFYPYFKEKWAVENDFLGLRSVFFLTLSAQIGVFGILVYNFETFSLISLPANLIIVPFIPFIMSLGGLMLLTSFYWPLSQFFSWLTFFALKMQIWVVDFLAKAPGAKLSLEGLGFWWMIGYYVLLILIINEIGKGRKRRFKSN
ncbi:MAG TPA: ComEC family competence protein [Candidatus Moranbacteria bacterium]|nr:ComEC family competence protein [Candidatus Moranbacteria bacterium]